MWFISKITERKTQKWSKMAYEPIHLYNYERTRLYKNWILLINEGLMMYWKFNSGLETNDKFTEYWWICFPSGLHPTGLLCPLGQCCSLIINMSFLYVIIFSKSWHRFRGGVLLLTSLSLFLKHLECPCQNQVEFS